MPDSPELSKGTSNERIGPQSYAPEGLALNHSSKPYSNSVYGRDSSPLRQPRRNADTTYATPSRDTALQDYTPSSSSYAPNGYMSSRPSNGPRHPAYPPLPSRSSTLPPNSSSRAQQNYNTSLSPTASPTSRNFAGRSDSPPASTYFSASSQHKMTPTPGHARDLGEHFSFSTTLRRHSLGPTEDILPSFSRGGTSSGVSNTIQGRIPAFLKPALRTLGIEKFLFPRREDEEMNAVEFGHDGPTSSSSPTQERSTSTETVSGKYASMPAKVLLGVELLFSKFCLA